MPTNEDHIVHVVVNTRFKCDRYRAIYDVERTMAIHLPHVTTQFNAISIPIRVSSIDVVEVAVWPDIRFDLEIADRDPNRVDVGLRGYRVAQLHQIFEAEVSVRLTILHRIRKSLWLMILSLIGLQNVGSQNCLMMSGTDSEIRLIGHSSSRREKRFFEKTEKAL